MGEGRKGKGKERMLLWRGASGDRKEPKEVGGGPGLVGVLMEVSAGRSRQLRPTLARSPNSGSSLF